MSTSHVLLDSIGVVFAALLVAFVASPLAGFINGANLRVDGGVVQSVN